MFEKWFKENNENIYILKEDLDILNSDKDLNILNLYLNLNKKNGEFVIEELLKDRTEIKLFTRPRRFGKTLNMTTLKYFFDVKNAEENRKLFKDLYIEKSEYFKEQGQYPVIFITMKDLKKNTWEQMNFAVKSLISNLYNEFEYIREKLNEKDLIEFEKIWFKKEDGDYDNSLRLLSEYLYNYYQKRVILLIDEYDNPLIVANQNGYYKEEGSNKLL